jgi:hypothetical protein
MATGANQRQLPAGSPRAVEIGGENETLAICRADAINMAVASFSAAEGRAEARRKWAAAKASKGRYKLLSPYLAFAPIELSDYMPKGFSLRLPASIEGLGKVPLQRIGGRAVKY